MSHGLIVSGAAACFPRPEMVTASVTTDVMTPIAARGIFEAVHWTPAIHWQVERIEVLNPIRSRWVRFGGAGDGERWALELIDVSYAIRARFELTAAAGPLDNAGQHANMFRTRAKRRQFFRTPYLGRRDLVADVRAAEKNEPPASHYAGSGAIDLGWMLHDRDSAGDRRLRFYRPVMIDGVIEVPAADAGPLPA